MPAAPHLARPRTRVLSCGGTVCVRGACKMRMQREQEKDQAYRPVFLFRTRTTEEVHT